MQLALTPEEAEFRDELRNFYRTKIPAEIRERTRTGSEANRDDIVTANKILH
ncbi:acyl-CoA dehydrogenase, partial [Enterococcus faecium]